MGLYTDDPIRALSWTCATALVTAATTRAEMSSMPARVLATYHLANTFGGSFNSVLDVLRAVDRRRFEPIVMVPGRGNCADTFHAMGLRVVFGTERAGERSLHYVRAVVASAWRLRRWRIDLVYVSDYVAWRSAQLAAARLLGIPRVVHVRSPREDGYADPELIRATVIVGNSAATLAGLRRQVPPERLRVVYNFVDLDRFADGRDIRREFFTGTPPVVGFVGVFRPEKGIEYFLEMARDVHALHPDARFLAVGGESTVEDVGWLDRMKRLATDLGVADVVCFPGSRNDIPDVMHSIDVLVVPSLNEGFGRVIVEAAAASVPSVGADAAGIPEVIEDGVTGLLVPPRNGKALAHAVDRLLRNPSERRGLGRAAAERASRLFTPKGQVSQLEHAWCDALSTERRP